MEKESTHSLSTKESEVTDFIHQCINGSNMSTMKKRKADNEDSEPIAKKQKEDFDWKQTPFSEWRDLDGKKNEWFEQLMELKQHMIPNLIHVRDHICNFLLDKKCIRNKNTIRFDMEGLSYKNMGTLIVHYHSEDKLNYLPHHLFDLIITAKKCEFYTNYKIGEECIAVIKNSPFLDHKLNYVRSHLILKWERMQVEWRKMTQEEHDMDRCIRHWMKEKEKYHHEGEEKQKRIQTLEEESKKQLEIIDLYKSQLLESTSPDLMITEKYNHLQNDHSMLREKHNKLQDDHGVLCEKYNQMKLRLAGLGDMDSRLRKLEATVFASEKRFSPIMMVSPISISTPTSTLKNKKSVSIEESKNQIHLLSPK